MIGFVPVCVPTANNESSAAAATTATAAVDGEPSTATAAAERPGDGRRIFNGRIAMQRRRNGVLLTDGGDERHGGDERQHDQYVGSDEFDGHGQ